MKTPCKHCCQSGKTVELIGNFTDWQRGTTGTQYYPFNHSIIPCRFCNGTGWVDDDEIISVARKFVKDEYFENIKI